MKKYTFACYGYIREFHAKTALEAAQCALDHFQTVYKFRKVKPEDIRLLHPVPKPSFASIPNLPDEGE